MNDTIASLLRHGLTAAGGFLVAKGLASSDQVGQLAGAIATLVGTVWSIWKNRKPITPPAP